MNKIVRALRSGQITIPADFREKLGIDPDSLLQMTLMEGELRIKPVQVSQEPQGSAWLKEAYEAFSPVREEIKRKGFTEEQINNAIDRAVKAVRKSHVKKHEKSSL